MCYYIIGDKDLKELVRDLMGLRSNSAVYTTSKEARSFLEDYNNRFNRFDMTVYRVVIGNAQIKFMRVPEPKRLGRKLTIKERKFVNSDISEASPHHR